MGATLSVLGAGSILPRVGYGCSGYALRARTGGPVTLLDCGPGTIRGLAGVGVDLGEVRRVVVSHFHLDHCLDLFALAFARHNPSLAQAGEIQLVGPRGLRAKIEDAPEVLGRWAAMPRAAVLEVEPGASFEGEGLTWRSCANGHTPDSLSWRVDGLGETGQGSLVYTGDTRDDPRLVALAHGVEVLLAECSFPEEEAVENHLTPTSAGRLAQSAGAGKLILTHFYPSMAPEEARLRAGRVYSGEIELARDGRVFEL